LIDQLPRNDGVIFTGFLDDIRPVLSRSWLNVVPLTIGGGTRLKILESLAAGVPVVSTKIGAEGLDLVHGRDLLIADQPVDFADAVLSVLQAPALRARLAESGRMTVETRYDWAAINQKLDRYLTHLVAS
jgi:glycosyltransferase involved in cell wall biosynthesis